MADLLVGKGLFKIVLDIEDKTFLISVPKI